jgi:hypothetical protein
MNVAEKMRELIKILRKGINDVPLPDVKAECEEDWCDGYAIIQDVYCDIYDAGHYFDSDTFECDLKKTICDHFGCKSRALDGVEERDPEGPDDQVVVRYFRRCHEVEVYTLGFTRRNRDERKDRDRGHEAAAGDDLHQHGAVEGG